MNDFANNAYPLAVIGCNFRNSSSSQRAQVILEDRALLELSEELMRSGAARGIVALDTCNRNEWIIGGDNPKWAAELLWTHMISLVTRVPGRRFDPYIYLGEAAARHLLRVALGLESLVVGERQIAGQFFGAFSRSRELGCSCKPLNRISNAAGRLVRLADRSGCAAHIGRGVHSLALSYVEKSTARGQLNTVAVIGTGSIGRQVLSLVSTRPGLRAVPINRTVRDSGIPGLVSMANLGEVLSEVDAAIVCTGAPTPVITREMLTWRGSDRLRVIVDIGVPPQVDRPRETNAVDIVGLDELCRFQQGCDGEGDHSDQALLEELVNVGLEELALAFKANRVSNILDTVRSGSSRLVNNVIPEILGREELALSVQTRKQIEEELKLAIQHFASDLIHKSKTEPVREGEENP